MDGIINIMADSLLVKERFDIGEGYSHRDYKKIKMLQRIFQTTEDIDFETQITKLQIQYS